MTAQDKLYSEIMLLLSASQQAAAWDRFSTTN
jgi:hypothetical protein